MFDIRPLRPDDDRSAFHSGNADLDRFLHNFAGQGQFRLHISTTYVAVERSVILGYATISASSVRAEDLPSPLKRRLPRYPLPVLRLARLAVDLSARSRGVGSALLRAVFSIAHEMAGKVGCIGLVVDAKPDAIDYYVRLGFVEMEAIAGALGDRPEPTTMFIPLAAMPDPRREGGQARR